GTGAAPDSQCPCPRSDHGDPRSPLPAAVGLDAGCGRRRAVRLPGTVAAVPDPSADLVAAVVHAALRGARRSRAAAVAAGTRAVLAGAMGQHPRRVSDRAGADRLLSAGRVSRRSLETALGGVEGPARLATGRVPRRLDAGDPRQPLRLAGL